LQIQPWGSIVRLFSSVDLNTRRAGKQYLHKLLIVQYMEVMHFPPLVVTTAIFHSHFNKVVIIVIPMQHVRTAQVPAGLVAGPV